jgi:hypothetical protein
MALAIDHGDMECEVLTKSLNFPPTDRSPSTAEDFSNAIQSTHALRKEKNKRTITNFSIQYIQNHVEKLFPYFN